MCDHKLDTVKLPCGHDWCYYCLDLGKMNTCDCFNIHDIFHKDYKHTTETSFLLAYCYLNGRFRIKDRETAYYILCNIYDKKYPLALTLLSALYSAGVEKVLEPEKSVAYRLAKKASKKCFYAKQILSAYYVEGIGTLKNYGKARELAYERVHLGDEYAMNTLGVIYYTGRGVPKDPSTALYWLYEAAHRGHTEATLNLGIVHYEMKNYDMAKFWIEKTLNTCHASKAYFNLGLIHILGYKGPQNIIEGIKLLEKSNYDKAKAYLGNLMKKNYKIDKADEVTNEVEEICIFCYENRKQVVCAPCGHVYCCAGCSWRFTKEMKCALCKWPVESFVIPY